MAAISKEAQAAFPDAGWEIRTRDKASPQLERSVERFTQFLTLVALTTLLVGGVGVANAVAAHLARKRDAIGTMKALGASGGDVFAIYCIRDRAGRVVCHRHRGGTRRRAAVRGLLVARRHHSAAGRRRRCIRRCWCCRSVMAC